MNDELNSNLSSSEPSNKIEELSFLDKVAGIFVEPSKVFENIRLFNPKTIDWLVPIVILIILTIFTNLLVTSNPEIKAEIESIQRKAYEESLEKAVKEGKLTEQQKEEQLEQIEKFTSGPAMRIIQYISIAVFTFVFLFIITAVYHLIWGIIFKGQGNYANALSVYGLSQFINMVEIILVAILSIVMTKMLMGFSVSAFLNLEKGTLLNYVLSKVNPFTFWWLYVVGVGLAKVYDIPKNKSLLTILILWLIYVVVAKFVPYLSFGV